MERLLTDWLRGARITEISRVLELIAAELRRRPEALGF
jgi:hypothetical protein